MANDEFELVLADLTYILDANKERRWIETVRRWSNASALDASQCDIAIRRIERFLGSELVFDSSRVIKIRDHPVSKAIRDIALNSNLNKILFYDEEASFIRCRHDVSVAVKKQISAIISQRAREAGVLVSRRSE